MIRGSVIIMATRRSQSAKKDADDVAIWRCLKNKCTKNTRRKARCGWMSSISLPQTPVLLIVYMGLKGYLMLSIAHEADVSDESVQVYASSVAAVAAKANEIEFQDSKVTFQEGQYDESSVSVRKFHRGKRTRAEEEYIQTAVSVSPSKKARRVFGRYIQDKSSATLLPI